MDLKLNKYKKWQQLKKKNLKDETRPYEEFK